MRFTHTRQLAGQLISGFFLDVLDPRGLQRFFLLSKMEEKLTRHAGFLKKRKKFPENVAVNLESISTDTFCSNKQFDGGIFDWVSENFIFL